MLDPQPDTNQLWWYNPGTREVEAEVQFDASP